MDDFTVIATVVLAGVAVLTVYLNWRSVKGSRRTERYMKYVERYEKITSNLPYNVFAKKGAPLTVEQDRKVWLVNYINLCNEEYRDARRSGRIEKGVWESWFGFMVKAFERSAPLRDVFDEFEEDYPDLRHFLESKGAIGRKRMQVS